MWGFFMEILAVQFPVLDVENVPFPPGELPFSFTLPPSNAGTWVELGIHVCAQLVSRVPLFVAYTHQVPLAVGFQARILEPVAISFSRGSS